MSVILAGLLKYYPFALLLLLVRERFTRFVMFGLVAVAVMAWFVWQYHGEIVRSIRALPEPYYFAEGFGAQQLPAGLPAVLSGLLSVLGWNSDRTREVLQNPALVIALRALLLIGALLLAVRLAFMGGFRAAIAALPPREMNFLVTGATLICGCFFAGQSIGYRGIHLLLALPGLLVLARSQSGPRTRTLFRWAGYALIFNMWYMTVQLLVSGARVTMGGSWASFNMWTMTSQQLMVAGADSSWTQFPGYVDWIIHELAWWGMVVVLLALLFRFIMESPTWRALLEAFRRHPAPMPG